MKPIIKTTRKDVTSAERDIVKAGGTVWADWKCGDVVVIYYVDIYGRDHSEKCRPSRIKHNRALPDLGYSDRQELIGATA